MKTIISSFFIVVPVILMAQQESGIHFDQGLSWNQVKAKAKQEHKYIFVDCFTTWCGPCKAMEKDVYTQKEVSRLYNDKFIAVKLQMDKTDKDNDHVRSWYPDMEKIKADYDIVAYPSYLFFAPDGNAVHKGIGYMNGGTFIKLASDALDTTKQYYRLIANFKSNTVDTGELRSLALLKKKSMPELAGKMALDYMSRIPSSQQFSEYNLRFLAEFNSIPAMQNLVLGYMSRLTKAEFGQRRNRLLATSFCNYNDKPVQDLCIAYLKQLTPAEFADTSNLKFVIALTPLKSVQELAVCYLKQVKSDNFKDKYNLKLMEALHEDGQVRAMANYYIQGRDFSRMGMRDPEFVKFIMAFTNSFQDPGFSLTINNAETIDSIMGDKYYTENHIDDIEWEKYLWPLLKNNYINKHDTAIDWDEFEFDYIVCNKKYSLLMVERLISKAELSVSLSMHDWEGYFKYAIEWVDKYGSPLLPFGREASFNLLAWTIFEHSTNKLQLSTAISWMNDIVKEDIVKNTPGMYDTLVDTLANLLYKNGQVEEALVWEAKTSYKDTYEKMLKGLPTWPQESRN